MTVGFTRPRRWRTLGGSGDPVPAGIKPRNVDRGRRIGIVLAATLWRTRVARMSQVPAEGGVLVVANHQNFLDGPLVFGQLTRRVSILIKAEAVHGPIGKLVTTVGQYAIDREQPSRDVLLAALAQLRDGGVIGLFPEGTRGEGNVDQIQAGAGWLAARSGAVVLPVAIRGVARPGRWRRFRPVVHLLVGEPFSVPQGAGKSLMAAATEQIRERLAATVQDLDRQIGYRKDES